MTDAQIKHMVDRFLGWKLPETFSPDAGISFKPTFNENTAYPMRHEPAGTNLFDATQATAMVRYMIESLPAPAATPALTALQNIEMREALSWALDLIDIYDKALVENFNEPQEAVYSPAHLAGKSKARAALRASGG